MSDTDKAGYEQLSTESKVGCQRVVVVGVAGWPYV